MKKLLFVGLVLLALVFISTTFAQPLDFTEGAGNDFWQNLIALHETKIQHWLAFIYIPIMVLIYRLTPYFKDQVAKHEDVLEVYERKLKEKKTDRITEAEAKVVSAMAWKSAISYAVIIIATTMVIVSL